MRKPGSKQPRRVIVLDAAHLASVQGGAPTVVVQPPPPALPKLDSKDGKKHFD